MPLKRKKSAMPRNKIDKAMGNQKGRICARRKR
jgi:hypothetical protein